MGYQLWGGILLDRLLPSITSTLSALLVVWLLIHLFRVRNPGTRYALFHLPLIKGLLVLLRGVPEPLPGREDSFRFGVQLLDPLSVIRLPSFAGLTRDVQFDPIDLRPEWDGALARLVLIATVAIAAGFLAYRWVALLAFYRRLLSLPTATRYTAPGLFDILDRLVPALGVTYPRVVLVDDPPIGPCTVGVRPPTVILSSRLLGELDEDQLEGVLAHELAHVSRRDGILHWPSLVLRDLLAFNPVAHRIFDRLLVEREKDSDQRAAEATGRPGALAKALVDVALLAQGARLRPAPGSMSLRHNLMGRTPVVEERVIALLGGPVPASRLRPIGLALLALFLALVRIYVHFPLAGQVIMLE